MFSIIIGWIANISFGYGVYSLGKKKIIGFYTCVIGNILYGIQAFIMSNSPLVWLSISLTILNIKGIIEWRKDEKKNN